MNPDSSVTTSTRRINNILQTFNVNAILPSNNNSLINRPELIPAANPLPLFSSSIFQSHLQWLKQKNDLGQDVFLLGSVGPLRRLLALEHCANNGLQYEYIMLTRDTTEADLKQRREILANKSSAHIDSIVINAALQGKILIIEGIEKAERNVLPILNNLLENREMALDDGRFLMAPIRYQKLMEDNKNSASSHLIGNSNKLLQTDLTTSILVPVHPNFRVIAVGLPSPPFPGNPLDPPLRSRFQSRRIDSIPVATLLQCILKSSNNISLGVIQPLITFVQSLQSLITTQASLAGVESKLLAFNHLPHCAELNILSGALILSSFPLTSPLIIFNIIYPYTHAIYNDEALELVNNLIANSLGVIASNNVSAVTANNPNTNNKIADKSVNHNGLVIPRLHYLIRSILPARGYSKPYLTLYNGFIPSETDLIYEFIPNNSDDSHSLVAIRSHGSIAHPELPLAYSAGYLQHEALSALLQSYAAGRDICILAAKGEGKSFLLQQFLRAIGQPFAETLYLYKDMSSRDLIARRSTTQSGATVWINTCLIEAMKTGRIAVLDGLHRLNSGVINSLERLILDRTIQLNDGSVYVSLGEFDRIQSLHGYSLADMELRKIYAIHPSFCIIALANLPNANKDQWLDVNILPLFHFHYYFLLNSPIVKNKLTGKIRPNLLYQSQRNLPNLNENLKSVLLSLFPQLDLGHLDSLLQFTQQLVQLNNDNTVNLEIELSLRQLIRIAKKVNSYKNQLFEAIEDTLLIKFLSLQKRELVYKIMQHLNIVNPITAQNYDLTQIQSIGKKLTIGEVCMEVFTPQHPELVPDIRFFPIAQHRYYLQELLRDFALGENILMIGVQGVGKNVLADKLLNLLQIEREYIQLHRDTTVPSLILTPSILNGQIVYSDSALVRAMKYGRVLLIDEIDKAPQEVVIVLKALLEDGEILLIDQRRFIGPKSPLFNLMQRNPLNAEFSQFSLIHPHFRIISLANPPNFPFLGNNFYAELGDCYSVHYIENPEQNSEIQLLRGYAPNLALSLLKQLTAVFMDLRQLVEEGLLSYPYSTRELVNIVKHLHRYPNDNIAVVLRNILDFDSFDEALLDTLNNVFHKHGIPTANLINLNSGTSAAEKKLEIAVAKPYPLPSPEFYSKLWRDVDSHTVILSPAKQLEVFQPPDYDLPSFKQANNPNSSGSNPIFTPYRPIERLFSSRANRFHEELYQFKNSRGTVVATLPSFERGFLHILTIAPFALYTYDLFNSNKPSYCTVNLTNLLVNYWQNEGFVPAPRMIILGKQQKVAIYIAHFAALIVLNPFDSNPLHAAVHSLNLDLNRTKLDRFQEVQHEVVMLNLSENYLILYTPSKSSLIHIVQVYAQHNKFIHRYFYLPNRVLVKKLNVVHHDRLIVTDMNDFDYDLLLLFDSAGLDDVKLYNITTEYCDDKSNPYPVTFISSPVAELASLPASLLSAHQAEVAKSELIQQNIQRTQLRSDLPSSPQLTVRNYHLSTTANEYFSFLINYPTAAIDITYSPTSSPNLGLLASVNPRRLLASQFNYSRANNPNYKRPNYSFSYYCAQNNLLINAHNFDKTCELEIIDPTAQLVKVVPILSQTIRQSSADSIENSISNYNAHYIVQIAELHDQTVAIIQNNGVVRILELREKQLLEQQSDWQKMFGKQQRDENQCEEEARFDSKEGGEAGEGGMDPESSVQENSDEKSSAGEEEGGSGKGGIGGSGEGGIGGRGKGKGKGKSNGGGSKGILKHLDLKFANQEKKEKSKQKSSEHAELSPEQVARVLEKAQSDAAAAIKKTIQIDSKRLKEAGGIEVNNETYARLYQSVAKEIQQLRVIIEQTEARERERVWLKNQNFGELDENRLIDGLVGDSNIYKHRGLNPNVFGLIQKKPKKIQFVMDVSSSMGRFNSRDRRLDRTIACTIMIMEAMIGFQHKFDYSITGHDGGSANIPFVSFSSPPKSQSQRLKIIEQMYYNANFCESGDNTLSAAHFAIKEVLKHDADDYFVILLSDANVGMYGITAQTLAKTMNLEPKVHSYAIFIAGDSTADWLISGLAPGRGYLCTDTADLPKVFKHIFTESLVDNLAQQSKL
jgi:MoxR-like ATPase